jgi:hypothetical protein
VEKEGTKVMKARIIQSLVTVSALFILGMQGCDSGLETVPPELIGIWDCSSKRFESFSFEVTKKALIFRDEEAKGLTETNPIEKITRKQKKGQRPLYIIHYKDKDRMELTFAFYYELSGGGTIRLKNQEAHVFRRVTQ